jgi:hypothetical protein
MTRLLSKLLVTTALLSGPASADPLTIGYWDSALGGGVTPLASSAGTEILWQNQLLGTGFGFGDLVTLLIPNAMGNPTFEFAIEDAIAPPQGGTIRVYTTWQGVVNGGQYADLAEHLSAL